MGFVPQATVIDVLLRHLAQDGAVVVREVAHRVVECEAGLVRALAVLVVADLVDREKQVDEIAGGAELLVAGVWVCVCAEELATTLEEEGALFVGQDLVAVDPL